MHIKKYRASSLKEATQIMKDELGAEALILGTRVVPDENDKRLKLYEITAGYDKFEVAQETKEKVAKQNIEKEKDKKFFTFQVNIRLVSTADGNVILTLKNKYPESSYEMTDSTTLVRYRERVLDQMGEDLKDALEED